MLEDAVKKFKKLENFVDPNKYRKYAIVCAVLFWSAAIISFFIFPHTLKFILKSQLKIKPGTFGRKLYEEIPFPIVFKIYIFNITNKDEVHNGGKPHLQEIGPYVFHKFITRIDTEDDNDEDTVEFTLVNKWEFKPKLNNGLTGDEIITVFNPVLMSIALGVNVDRQPMLPLAASAINSIFHNPTDVFWTGRAMDLLFDGIHLDCSSTDFNAKAVCSIFESGESQAIQPVDENTFKFSFFGGYNNTDNGRFKTMRGSKNIFDLNRVVEVDGLEELELFEEDYCNEFRGTDGLLFPPFMNKKDKVWGYERSICLSLAVHPVKSTRFRGMPVYFYTTDFGDIANDEKLRCYCRSEDHCPIKGTYDLFNCIGVPIFLSLPHFYLADQKLLDDIASGINPRKKDHMIFVHFETFTGTPMTAAKRAQINFEVVPIPEIEPLKNLRAMMFPMIWIEESISLNKTFTFLFLMLYIFQTLNKLLKLSLIVTGVGAIAFAVALALREQDPTSQNTKNIRQIKQFIEDTVEVDEKKNIEKSG